MWLTLLARRLALAQAAAAATAAFVVAHILLLFAQRSAGGLHRRTRCRQLALHTGAVLLRRGQLGRDLQGMELDQRKAVNAQWSGQLRRIQVLGLSCCAVTRLQWVCAMLPSRAGQQNRGCRGSDGSTQLHLVSASASTHLQPLHLPRLLLQLRVAVQVSRVEGAAS